METPPALKQISTPASASPTTPPMERYNTHSYTHTHTLIYTHTHSYTHTHTHSYTHTHTRIHTHTLVYTHTHIHTHTHTRIHTHTHTLVYTHTHTHSYTHTHSTCVSLAVLMTVMTNATEISARLNSTYRCVSSSTVSLSAEVNLTFSDVRMEAYMRGANLSTDESVCSADQTVTTTAPTQSPRTTAAPSPVPLPAPERGNYTLTNRNGTACLLALMGLQLNVTHRSKSLNQMVSEVVNLQPNRTTASGSCGFTVATLVLTEDLTNLTFTFTLVSACVCVCVCVRVRVCVCVGESA
uniref:Lysosome-associated membrane glycoprotein 2-like luminal domain-containing protein n=1 Tax=Sinocyclocheilus grahami TaxID=75366 RepID=A0A672M0V3_SINGR